MRIVICGSIAFAREMKEVAESLEKGGDEVVYPEPRVKGEERMEETAGIKKEFDLIRGYFQKIKESDAVLIMNLQKNEIDGYIGANTFLEIGFAYALSKKIFLWNPVPKMWNTDEINAMDVTVVNREIKNIR